MAEIKVRPIFQIINLAWSLIGQIEQMVLA